MSWLLAFSPEELTAIRLSLWVAFWAMLGSLPIGVLIALLLSRRHFWGKSLLNVVVHLPLIMPPVVTGYLLLLLFGRKGAIGEFGATITFVSNIPGETQTLPTAIYMLTQVPGGDLAALRLTLVSIAISMAALFASEALIERAARRVQGI